MPPELVGNADEAFDRVASLVTALVPDHLYWRKVFLELDMDPLLLAQILGDAAIIHAARQYDLPKMLTALDAMIALPCLPSLTVVEGAMFLVRQQFQNGCIGIQFVTLEARKTPVAQEATSVISDCLKVYAARFASGR